jgi:hypothetical protein
MMKLACGSRPLAAVMLLSALQSLADAAIPRDMAVDPAVPTPESVLGFAPGDRPARYDEIARYMDALAAESNRVRLADYGRNASGHRLLLLTVSSPANLARLEDIDARLRRLGDGAARSGGVRASADDLPASVWLGYGIHGDEISGPDAALEVAYRLAAGQDEATRSLLDRLVIRIDPVFNADGRERALAHVSVFSRRIANDDLQDVLHETRWPVGRGNRYWFDLNRDAVFTVQAESRARVKAIGRAQPQLMIDAHEMGPDETFLFAAPNHPFNPHLPPSVHRSWEEFAADHAKAFDRDGTSYYTRSWDEVFYPGYFDVWPGYLGAVPIIYEQAATSGVTVELPNGLQRTYAQAVEHQMRSSLANLRTAAEGRERLLARWSEARAANRAASSSRRAWVLLPDDAYKSREAAAMLLAQGLEVERLRSATKASGLHSMWDAEGRSMSLPAGTLLVRSAQPLGGLVRNIFDFHVPMTADFVRKERTRLDLGQGTLLYDTTAWSLPHAYAASAYWTRNTPSGDWEPLDPDAPIAPSASGIPQAAYGYLYRDPSLHVTARLLERGVKVRVATEPFTYQGRRYEAGTALIRNDDQKEAVVDALGKERALGGTEFVAADSARITEGPDLGDPGFKLLRKPKVALLAGEGMDSLSVGSLLHLFDAAIGMPVTMLDFTGVGGKDLSKYEVIVVPDVYETGSAVAMLKDGRLDRLRHWVEGGGTLVGLRQGAQSLIEAELTAAKVRGATLDKYPPLVLGRAAPDVAAQDFPRAAGAGARASTASGSTGATLPVIGPASRAFLLEDSARGYDLPAEAPTLEKWLENAPAAEGLKAEIGTHLKRYLPHGAYLGVHLKPRHWLGFGAAGRLPAMFREGDALIADGGVEAVGRYAPPRELALSGLVWPEAVGYVADTAFLMREGMGRGQVILFASDPVFRGYSLGTQRLFLNAVLLGPAFK